MRQRQEVQALPRQAQLTQKLQRRENRHAREPVRP
ncbi:hypothetical protein LJR260_004129 [Variovorax paradoxus]